MRRVTVDKILLQPAVQVQWLRDQGSVCFEVGPRLAAEFAALWYAYQHAGKPEPVRFLETRSIPEDDVLFALFAGAVEADRTLEPVAVEVCRDRVIWRTGVI